MKLTTELISLIFTHGIMCKNGRVSEDDIIDCFEMAVNFGNAKHLKGERLKHMKEVSKANNTRICVCGHKLKDGERIHDLGWRIGVECSNCR